MANRYEVKKAKNGQFIPIVDNIHLHSEYDPEKEAREFSERHSQIIKKSNRFLILGLGFGHHVSEIAKEVSKKHKIYQIYVIEPNEEVYQGHLQHHPFNDDHIKIICESSVEKIYKNKDFLFFLSLRPEVIFHPPSLNIYKDFFESYLSYKAQDGLKEIIEEIEDDQIKKYLLNQSINASDYSKLIDRIKEKKDKSKEDFLFLAFDQIN